MPIAKEISTNISNVLSLLATCGNTRLKYSKISETLIYLRVWCRKEGIDCEEVDEDEPSLDASLISPHDIPAILRLLSGLCIVHVVKFVEVHPFKEGLVSAHTAH